MKAADALEEAACALAVGEMEVPEPVPALVVYLRTVGVGGVAYWT